MRLTLLADLCLMFFPRLHLLSLPQLFVLQPLFFLCYLLNTEGIFWPSTSVLQIWFASIAFFDYLIEKFNSQRLCFHTGFLSQQLPLSNKLWFQTMFLEAVSCPRPCRSEKSLCKQEEWSWVPDLPASPSKLHACITRVWFYLFTLSTYSFCLIQC